MYEEKEVAQTPSGIKKGDIVKLVDPPVYCKPLLNTFHPVRKITVLHNRYLIYTKEIKYPLYVWRFEKVPKPNVTPDKEYEDLYD